MDDPLDETIPEDPGVPAGPSDPTTEADQADPSTPGPGDSETASPAFDADRLVEEEEAKGGA